MGGEDAVIPGVDNLMVRKVVHGYYLHDLVEYLDVIEV